MVAAPNPVLRIAKSSLQQIFVFAALAIIYLFFCFAAPNFAQFGVALDIIQQSAYIGVMALGATFVIATSGIDLSSGTGMTLVAVFAGIFLSGDWMNLPLGGGLMLILLVGALLGLVNGVNISFLGLPPFIATLAMMMAARGLALVLTNKSTISIKNPDYKWLAAGELIPGVANAIPLFIILAIIASVLLNKTLLGRYALAIGSNEEATRLSGVNIKLWKTLVYVVAGIFVALGAILYSARFGFVQPSEGVGFELYVIAAVVIGGTSLAGGRANILGTVVGALIMETLRKGMQMMGVAQEWQLVVTGIVVLIAVFVDNVRRRRAAAV
ncbi:ABC transporter permease [Arachnia propionica]|uniref:ABC transporter permease n=1 Tax=Arachnia propionica TaxID=1750 RepID=A0AB37I3I7_9ACTN|nr:ABC transporter permease [Arachnia propionica]QUC12706.1 ABC transporter permease [Arachnia propionica]QUC15615.1 ABC transporter permease [Arachnia propionica]RPA19306.1 ABC transporter permease [Arachnia propionica]